jgi:integrase
VCPVATKTVDAILPFLSRHVAAMVKLQLVTGMRPGEVCSMRSCDIDTTTSPWAYRPADHKTAHRGHNRVVFLGPRAQEIVKPFLRANVQEYLFSPAEAEAERRAAASARRKTPAGYGNGPGKNRKRRPRVQPGERYTTDSYRGAIEAACERAFPPPAPLAQRDDETGAQWRVRLTAEQRAALAAWRREQRFHPHQLRHTAATRIREEHGLEAAQVILGHRSIMPTQIYAEASVRKAAAVMADVG